MANDTTNQSGAQGQLRVDGRPFENIDTSKTLTAADCGVIQNVIKDGITITLPATVVGLSFTVRNGGVPATSGPAGTGGDGSVLVKVSPNASDNIYGNNMTAADNKAIQNTKATSQVGDYVTLIADGTTAGGWSVSEIRGIWAREA